MELKKPFQIRAPGRVCLFGEHSDYLGLDVITAAIDRYIEITASPREDGRVCINYIDLKEQDEFSLGEELEYRHNRDYVRSAFNVLSREGITAMHGWDLKVSGSIPIAGGLSSSTALAVASIMTAAEMAGKPLGKEDTVLYAFDAEVTEFGERGGMMDHFASVYGGIIHVEMTENQRVSMLPASIGSMVIGDSGVKKEDTVGDLSRIRKTVESEYRRISEVIPGFNPRTTVVSKVSKLLRAHPSESLGMAEASLRNRDLTARAFKLLGKSKLDENELGKMIDEHHGILRDGFKRSTLKIENMISAAKSAGAIGCKINGSGAGGTMLAYSAGQEMDVASAIQNVGGVTFIVNVGEGVSKTILKA
ncbi:MAG: mevalonate kinase family protein [Candidatus Thorarchaeota archaeon]|jgi:galactokinase